MAFESLLHKPLDEAQILDHMVKELQANYLDLQNACYFLKLEKCGDKLSKVIWIKAFKDAYDLADFYYDTAMQRAAIMTKFHEQRYEILCQGHFFFNRFEIWPDRVSEGCPQYDDSGDRETRRMIPREIYEKGFGEISQILATTKRHKAV